jgi:hypothetical protein
MVPIKIRYFSNFCDSKHCKEKVELICHGHLIPEYGEKFILTEKDDFTHAIILNTPMPVLSIPKENVIGFAFEPPAFLNITKEFIEYAQNTIGKYYIGEKGNLPNPFVEGYAFMWHIVPSSLSLKNRLCSIMVSEKKNTWGHRYRHELVRAILSTTLPIDIYGRGCRFFRTPNSPMDRRLCGEFKEMDSTIYSLYSFHVAVENFSHHHYISEKILNPLLCGTTPIYWGSNKINDYFPEMVYTLSGNLQQDMNQIFSILREPAKYMKKINIHVVEKTTNILRSSLFIQPKNYSTAKNEIERSTK